MMRWDYKGIHRKYDMSGEIVFLCGSKVKVCDWIAELPAFMKEADCVFVDPPWNIGNVNTFYYKAGKRHVALDFLQFSARLFSRIDEINPATLFIEMGKEYLSWYIEECKKRYEYVTFYNSTYYRKKENKCYVIHSSHNFKTSKYRNLEDMDEADIIAWICANHPYECIGDLCMGTGLVGKHAYLNGRRFVGTELNPKRLALLVDFIKKREQKR